MVEVIVNIIPHGDRDKIETIAEMDIINDLSHGDRPHYGNYKIKIDGKESYIKDHDRGDGIWLLVKKALSHL